MKTITFRPLRRIKKTGKITVASYMSWYKVKCANYNKFSLKVLDEYSALDKSEFVYDHEGELLYHFNYNPWDVFVYHGSCIDPLFDWDYLRETYKSFSIDGGAGGHISRHWRGTDCYGTPTFSHLTADKIVDAGYKDLNEFEPLTVGYVIDWLGWFLYQLENSYLKIGK